MNKYKLSLAIFTALLIVVTGALAGDLTPVRHDFPRVGSFEVLCGDFHMHTVNSDGRLTTRQRVEESYKWGYDAIAVTDHGKTRAYGVAKYVGEELGMVVIRGVETGIAKNEHLVVLGVPGDYKPIDSHRWAETTGADTAFYQDELAKISKAGGIVIYPHPHVGYREPVIWGVKQGIIQGIEFKNGAVGKGWNTVEDHGTYWYPSAVDFAMKNNLTIFANSDVHSNRAAEASPVTLLLVTERSSNGVMDAIKARRTAAWFNGMLWGRENLLTDLINSAVSVTASSDGQLTIENKSPLTLKATIEGADLELGPYQKAQAGKRGDTGVVTLKWSNIWTSLTSNLETKVTLR